MARPLRITFEGAWYHVMNRGAAKKNIFHSNVDRYVFLNLLERIHSRYKIEIHSYCLMSNHYHLLVRTPLANISQAIKYLDGVYAQKFNWIYKIDGPLFRGRFKSKLVDDDTYLTHLTRYIHLNPQKAKLCNYPWEYKWSSCKSYFGLSSKNSWLYVHEILDRFKTGANNKFYNYWKFLQDDKEDILTKFFQNKIPAIGTPKFIHDIKQNFLVNLPHEEIPEERLLHNMTLPSIDTVISTVCKYFNISQDDCYQRANHIARNIIIYLAIEVCNKTLGEVGSIFTSIKKTRISVIHKEMVRCISYDAQLKNEIEQIVRSCGK